jgi:hypothetical protein
MDAPTHRTTPRAKIRGLLVAALAALGLFVLRDLFLPSFFHIDTGQAAPVGSLYLTYVLGASLAVCLVLGYPLWTVAETSGPVSRRDSAILGAALASLVAVAQLAWMAVSTPADARGFMIFSTLWTIASGALAGFCARAAAGPTTTNKRPGNDPGPSLEL